MRQRTADSRVLFAGVAYATQEWGVSEVAQLLDMSNTEGIPTSIFGPGGPAGGAGPAGPPGLFTGQANGPAQGITQLGTSAVLADIPQARVTLRNMTFDDAFNPFVAPIVLSIGRFYPCDIFPAGIGQGLGSTVCWGFPSLCINQIDHGGRIPGAQPVTIHGQNDGAYHEPWNATYY